MVQLTNSYYLPKSYTYVMCFGDMNAPVHGDTVRKELNVYGKRVDFISIYLKDFGQDNTNYHGGITSYLSTTIKSAFAGKQTTGPTSNLSHITRGVDLYYCEGLELINRKDIVSTSDDDRRNVVDTDLLKSYLHGGDVGIEYLHKYRYHDHEVGALV